MVGLAPRAKLPALVRAFISARQGRITYGELSRRLAFGWTRSTAVSYMGFATKTVQ
jgi:2-polyprenyl-6-hydroxyphenyl methylase / 3-demethylubiquinone-9 3-methyltransferase